jgi:sensor histidine kinase YesM
MLKLTETIKKNLPLRISLMIGSALSLLLLVSLLIMLFYSRKAMKEDALTKATYSLEQAMTNVDNILLSVEEATGNTYCNILIKQSDDIQSYGKKIVESSPYISNCIIALEGSGNPYKNEAWYINTVSSKAAKWVKMRVDNDSVVEQFVSFCLPIVVPDKPALGVIRADVSLSLLSSIIADAKPSPNSYCALIDGGGSFIVHPSGDYLFDFSAFKFQSESLHRAVNAMVSGDTGYAPFDLNGHRFLLFYKPFKRAYVPNRSMEDHGWSIGLAYAEDDIFGAYNRLYNIVLIITFVGIVLMYLHIRLIIRHRLMPLKMLTERTERIARGDFKEPIPASLHIDEIGVLQDNFRRMQKSLAVNMGQLDELTETIKERSKDLQAAYKEAKKADKMKTVFLHNMTNQMIEPAYAIADDVSTLCNYDKATADKPISQLVGNIQQNGNTITKLLNNLINLSEQEMAEEKGGKS